MGDAILVRRPALFDGIHFVQKQIGQLARTELEALFERKVHLFLFVKVRENWAEDPMHYREMGLDPPKRK